MLLDLVKNTPPVYTEESRDFQLFLRVYNSVFNSIVNDANSLLYITDSKLCKDNMLNLVKSRVGFLTNKEISDSSLRIILKGFSDVIKYKGTLRGVTLATNLFLNSLNIKSDIIVFYTDEGGLVVNRNINDHTIVIGLSALVENYYILEDMLRYVAPAGVGISVYFFYMYNKYDWLRDLNSAELLFVGNDYADSIRYTTYDPSETYSVGDLVCYNNIYYICIQEATDKIPDNSPDYWEVSNVATRIISSVNTLGISTSDATFEDTLEISHSEDDLGYDISDNMQEGTV